MKVYFIVLFAGRDCVNTIELYAQEQLFKILLGIVNDGMVLVILVCVFANKLNGPEKCVLITSIVFLTSIIIIIIIVPVIIILCRSIIPVSKFLKARR